MLSQLQPLCSYLHNLPLADCLVGTSVEPFSPLPLMGRKDKTKHKYTLLHLTISLEEEVFNL